MHNSLSLLRQFSLDTDWRSVFVFVLADWSHTHTVKLRVSYMPLNVNTLCMWSAPPSDSEHVKNNSSFSLTVCLRVPLTTSALTPSVSLRCLKRPNEYWWAERSACSNQWPAKYNKNCSSLPVTSIKHWFGNADILLRPFYFPSSSWLLGEENFECI